MNDVAREAGVSRGTVSNYLNKKNVRGDAKHRIEKAIRKLHYVRNTAARDLRASVSSYVVLVIPTVWTPFFSELTYWIQKELNDRCYKVILCISNNQYDQEKDYVKMAEEQRVAGIISISYSQLTQHVRLGIPLVSIEKDETGLFPLISSDNYSGGQLAAKEFYKRGIEQYIFIGSNQASSTAMVARQSGFIDFCNDRNLNYKVYTTPSSRHKKEFHVQHEAILKKVTADSLGKIGIFAYADESALETWRILKELQVRVPEDVQIIGFDGWKIFDNRTLGISSIRQPVKDIASCSVKELDKQIKGEGNGSVLRKMLPISFYSGETTSEI